MKKAILILALASISLSVFSQDKTAVAASSRPARLTPAHSIPIAIGREGVKVDSVKKAVPVAKPAAAPKPAFVFNENDLRTLPLNLSAHDVWLLSLTDQEWYELEHEQRIAALDNTEKKERILEIKKDLRKIYKQLQVLDHQKFDADTAAAGKPAPRGKKKR